jgi:hypothetical protein
VEAAVCFGRLTGLHGAQVWAWGVLFAAPVLGWHRSGAPSHAAEVCRGRGVAAGGGEVGVAGGACSVCRCARTEPGGPRGARC